MKAIIENVNGDSMHVEIDVGNSPLSIVQKIYNDDPTAGSQIFSNQKAVDQLMAGNVDESKSSFDLITLNGDNIRAAWKEPLCNQSAIKEALAAIEAEGQEPTFVVGVSSIVAGH